jgi:microcystin-dependent protein
MYVGEIRMFAGNFAPSGWMFCQGQTLPISENDALFGLIGTTYGGDGQTTFCLPDLRGRVPIHSGGTMQGALGQTLGDESVTLVSDQMPEHNHPFLATTAAANTGDPENQLLADVSPGTFYAESENPVFLAPAAVSATGGGEAHTNMMPYVALNYIIAIDGDIAPKPPTP